MANDLKLRVLFGMVDSVTRPLRNILAGNKDMAKSVKESRDRLKELDKAQKDVGAFRGLHASLRTTRNEMAAAQQRVNTLAAGMRATSNPTKQMTREFERAKQAAAQLRTNHERQTAQLQTLRTRLSGAGIETRNLVQHERDLRNNINSTNEAMRTQQNRLTELAARERRLREARSKMQAVQGVAAGMAVGGYAARRAGTTVLGDLKETVTEAKKWETDVQRISAFNLGDHATSDAAKFARAMKSYGTSATDHISLMRDAMSIFADEHHAQMVLPTLAKMKFANEAMFGSEEGHANEEKFMNMLKVIELRGGAVNEERFKDEANRVQQVLTATGGRVGGDQWRDFIQTGGVAAKQMRQDAFYFQMEPLIQEMGGHAVGTGLMSAYQNVYQGKTTVRAAQEMGKLGILDMKKVEYNKIGMIKKIKPGALAGGDLFKASPFEWMEQVLLPKMADKGITDPDKIRDMMATIFTNRTAANLFSTFYMQRELIHKSAAFNAKADGIDGMAEKGQAISSGREVDAQARLRDVKMELGEKVLPMYNQALLAGAQALLKVIGFMKEHETAAKVIIVTLTALAAILVVCGSLTIALAATLGPLAMIKFSMTTLGLQGGILARVLGGLGGALRMVGTVIMFVGRALLMNPIGLAITAIALAAYAIYTYWEPIKAFFSGLWDQVRTAFNGGIGSITTLIVNWSPVGLFYKAFAAVMSYFGVDMPAKFTEFGSNMMAGLVNGISNSLGSVKTSIMGAADSTVAWFKEKLGIHSPSRVFGQLGGFISEGAAIGIDGGKAKVAQAALALAATATSSFAPAAAQVPIDARKSVLSSASSSMGSNAGTGAASAAAASGGHTINIYPAPGADANAIARAVAAELDRRERTKEARHNSRLSD